MRISADDLNAYRAELIALGQSASDDVTAAIEGVRDDGRSSMRLAAIDALMDSIGVQGVQAQALAAQLFDEVCAAEGIDGEPAIYDDIIDADMLAGKVTWLCRKLVEGDRAGYVQSVGTLADFYTKRCNYVAQMRNCHRNNMRYARVPTGPDTCDWCCMLASRGFVYYTEADAKAGNHQHCDCLAIPGRGGDTFDDATQVEGYDPDEYYALWRESGFMPPKTNPTPYRMVFNHDTDYAEAYRNRSSSARRRIRRSSPARGLSPQDTELFYKRLNDAGTRAELDAEYRDILSELGRMGDRATDADWEDVGNHYTYLLELMLRKRRKGR